MFRETEACNQVQLFSISMVNLTEELHWLRLSRKLLADVLLGMMVNGVIHIPPVVKAGHLSFAIQGFFNAAHKDIGE